MSDDLEREIEQTREHLADTVDALTAKAESGAKRAVTIGVPVTLALVVGIIVWRRRG